MLWASHVAEASVDLFVLQEITLAEALCGTSFNIKHLDDRILKVASAPGEVIKPDSWKCIQDEGMPEHGRPYERGNLYIQFHVKFPESLSKQQVTSLQQTLGGGAAAGLSNGDTKMDVDENVEEVRSCHANDHLHSPAMALQGVSALSCIQTRTFDEALLKYFC